MNKKGQEGIVAPWVDSLIWILGIIAFTSTGLYLILKVTMTGLEILIDMLVEFKRAGSALVDNMRTQVNDLIDHLKK